MQQNRDEKCSAERATYHNCHRMRHWATVCRSRSVNEVTETERSEQTSYFLGSVCDEKSEQWTVQLQVDTTLVEFKIDTGADVTVISEDTFHTLKTREHWIHLTFLWTGLEVSCCVWAALMQQEEITCSQPT